VYCAWQNTKLISGSHGYGGSSKAKHMGQGRAPTCHLIHTCKYSGTVLRFYCKLVEAVQPVLHTEGACAHGKIVTTLLLSVQCNILHGTENKNHLRRVCVSVRTGFGGRISRKQLEIEVRFQ